MAVSLAIAACSGDDASAPTTGAPTTSATTSTTLPAATTTTTVAPAATTSTTSIPSGDAAPTSPTGLRSVAPFADYRWVPPLSDDAVYGGPATPTSFEDVLLVPGQTANFEYWASSDPVIWAEFVEHLERDGFVVAESYGNRFFHDGYKSDAYWDLPLFVTTDALYHSWHLVFDKVLRDT